MIRTLVIDDEQPARERLKQLLTAHPDVEVVGEADDGVEAAEKIAELAPDLVLLDIQMPEMSGIEASELLRELAPKLPVVLSTGYSAGVDLPDASQSSGLFTLAKPYTLEQMERVLRTAAASTKP